MFRERESGIKQRLLKIAMTMLVKDTKTKISKPRKKMKAALDQKYRKKLLNLKIRLPCSSGRIRSVMKLIALLLHLQPSW